MKTDHTELEEVEACKKWLKHTQAKKTKTTRYNRGHGYYFKHKVENWLRSDTNSEQYRYISEDSFNQAMRESGFDLEPASNAPNCRSFFYNVSFKES